MAAVVLALAMTAVLTFMMVIMTVASCIRIISEPALCECLRGLVRRSLDATIELYPGLSKGYLGAHPYSAADKDIGLDRIKEACKCAVAASVGVYNLLVDDLPVLDVVDLELLGVSEMLEDLPVVICDCYSHV